MIQNGTRVDIPTEKMRHSQWRKPTPAWGRVPKNIPLKDRMRRLLRTKQGRRIYRMRLTSIEPAYGHIKENLGLRQFNRRGLPVCRGAWRFQCAVYDLFMLFMAGVCPRTLPGASC